MGEGLGLTARAARKRTSRELVQSWVKLMTHSAKGITDKDFALAKKIDEVVLWRPAKDSPFEGGTPNKFVHVKK